ncbi:phage tail terminator-like protein [Reyranella sp.]|uniref:phage tail terminator-like protein n=1 Tax=Reyranella sp. TaxID=1929291 RepID=UPI00272FD85C|nr:phage tail terminator-like protein [Reyranella sp.]MDP2377784.1 phage tail terminator-like protein [Reyranella sp.]
MAADPLRDAFRTKLAAIKTDVTYPIAWPIKDTTNTAENPDVSAPYLELEWAGGDERQGTFGAPGQNIHDEDGTIFVNLCMPLGRYQAQAEIYGRYIRNGFRAAHLLTSEGRDVFITAASPLGGGENEAGLWVETIALAYETTNQG